MSVALIPGSFDPMTTGHLDIVKRALALYDKVIVAVMINDQKQYRHTLEERTRTVELTLDGLERVCVISSRGMLIDLFDEVGADVIVKGIRNEVDRAYEEKMAEWNLAHNPRAKTVFLEAADDFENISSSAVREKLARGDGLDGFVTPEVADYLKEIEKQK